jgi:Phosphatase
VSKARNRPPHLESKVGHQEIAPPATLEEKLERSHVAGRATVPGPSELRRLVERAATDRVQPVLLDDAWVAVNDVFGGTAEAPSIDPALTIAAARVAVARIVEVAGTGAHVALATSRPASLLTVYLALARLARISGGDVADDDDDSSPLRVDGRAARTLRWVDGVAVVTDGQSLCETRGPEAPAEWLFLVPRPALVIADGPYADAALDAGVEVIALAGLDHCSLAVARKRGQSCLVVPMWTDRPPGAYRPLLETALTAAISPAVANGSSDHSNGVGGGSNGSS